MEYFSWPDRRSDSLFQAQHSFSTACMLSAPKHWYRENGHKPWKDGAL